MAFEIARPPTAFAHDPSSKATARIKDERHLAWIRTLPSVISGVFGCEACHVRYGDPMYRKHKTAKGRKPDDCWTVPMTPDEHRAQHGMNEHAFWQAQGIDPLMIAHALYAVSGDTEAAIKIIRSVRTGEVVGR